MQNFGSFPWWWILEELINQKEHQATQTCLYKKNLCQTHAYAPWIKTSCIMLRCHSAEEGHMDKGHPIWRTEQKATLNWKKRWKWGILKWVNWGPCQALEEEGICKATPPPPTHTQKYYSMPWMEPANDWWRGWRELKPNLMRANLLYFAPHISFH